MIDLQLLLAAFPAWASLRFTDDQRRRLVAEGKPLGRKALSQIATIVTPETILAWRTSLERSIAEDVARYHGERSHLGPGNEIPARTPPQREGAIQVAERLGGLLQYYHRAVA